MLALLCACSRSDDELCAPSSLPSFGVRVCVEPSSSTSLAVGGACEEARVTCAALPEPCTKWEVWTSATGDCRLTLAFDGETYVSHVDLEFPEDICPPRSLPVNGATVVEIGPGCTDGGAGGSGGSDGTGGGV